MKLLICSLFLIVLLTVSNAVDVNVNWAHVVRTSRTTPTLQIVLNGKYRRESKIHKQIFDNLKNLQPKYCRFAGWFPYPKLVVAELDPPTQNQTFWNFTLLDPIFEDFMSAVNDNSHPVISLSTIPQWMFKTEKRVPYPDNPDDIDWSYSQGKELRDPTMKELADYYKRVVSWYAKGGFHDELNKHHESKYNYKLDHFEFLNEVESEHQTSPEEYTKRYDAVVKAVQSVVPDMKFVGLALIGPSSHVNYVNYFLNRSNHQANVPLDYISYHNYVHSSSKNFNQVQNDYFGQTDSFINTVKTIEKVRLSLSPQTKTTINELGTMLSYEGHNTHPEPIPDVYWNLSGAVYAYIFSHLTLLGIDVAGMSQLVGYPGQYPDVSMIHWDTGAPTARYYVLKLIIDHFDAGDSIVDTLTSGPDHDDVMALGSIRKETKRVLLINKRNKDVTVVFDNQKFKSGKTVRGTNGITNNITHLKVNGTIRVNLDPFEVSVLEFSN